MPSWVANCHLVGSRDYRSGYEWVPCASCMSPEFDREEKPDHEVAVYMHSWEKDNIPDKEGLPLMTNHAGKLGDVVRFMLKAEYILTNTYHGMYWATLLGRKVIVYPFASRHHHMRHPPVLLKSGAHWRDAMAKAKAYPSAIGECRKANLEFKQKVDMLISDFSS